MKRQLQTLCLPEESPSKKCLNSNPMIENLAFGKLLSKSGLNFRRSGQPILNEDQAVFQNKLKTALRNHHAYPQVIEEFITGFVDFIEDGQHLFLCLNSTLTDANCTSARRNYQESVVRLLIGNTDLQPKLIDILLEKLVEFCSEDESGPCFDGADLKQIPKMILFQFRWLDTLVDSSGFCKKVLEIFSCTSLEIQKDIISLLPEILEDKEHDTIANSWRDYLTKQTNLIVPILDALPCLSVSEDILYDVKEITLKMMDSVNLKDLPVIMKFLLESVTTEDALEILKGLKTKLNFADHFLLERTEIEGNRSHEVLMLEALKTSVRFKKLVGDTLLKLFNTERTETGGFQLSDLLVIFVLLDVRERKKATETLVVNSICKGLLDKSLVKRAFKRYPQICREYYLPIRGLADNLLCMNKTILQRFAAFLFVELFTVIDDPSILQDIIECLYIHAHSGRSYEMDSSLDVLLKLVRRKTAKIAPYGVFLKSFLDYLETYSLPRVRKVYDILGYLHRGGNGTGSDEQELHDDLHIIVRKQLGNSSAKYRRMGVVGALMLLKSSLTGSDDSSTLSKADLQSACSLLEMIEKQVEKDVDAKALFYDDLATAICKMELHPHLQTWLADHITNDFQDDFIVDATEECLQKIPMAEGELLFLLDESSEVGVALNLLPIAAGATGSNLLPVGKKRVRLSCLAPHFRLLRYCEQVTHHNNLEGIDALLGCPVYFLSPAVLENFYAASNTERKFICHCCFALVNWFIELVNAFVTQADVEIQTKVLLRIRQIVEIRNKLADFLAVTTDFAPPTAHFDVEVESVVAPSISKQKPSTKGKATRKRKKPATTKKTKQSQTQSQIAASIPQTAEDGGENSAEKTKKMPPISMNLYSGHFRELEMDVLITVLKHELVLNDEKSSLHVKPDELIFLLEDLKAKLDVVLNPAEDASKRGFFFKTKVVDPTVIHRTLLLETPIQIATLVVKLLPFIKGHLKNVASHFRKIADDDDSDDELVTSPVSQDVLSKAFKTMVLVVQTVFKWDGFKSSEEATLFDDALLTFVSKATSSSPTMPTDVLLKKVFSYFCHLIEVAPNFTCAVAIVGTLDVIVDKNTKHKLSDNLMDVTLIMLKKRWDEFATVSKESSTSYDDLAKLLTVHFKVCYRKLDALEAFVTQAIPELVKSLDDDGISVTYPTLTITTLPIFYRVLYEELIKMMRNKCTKHGTDDQEQLLLWSLSVKIFHILVNVVKEFETHKIFLICLKYGRIFIDLFLKWAMPLLDRTFRAHRDDVQSMLKTVQLSTRYLQHICSHSKLSKGVSLTNYVPPLRKVLEGLVYRVKAMLAFNNVKQAFWIGNLKNRTLQGQEILSQPSVAGDHEDTDQGEDPEDAQNSDTEVYEDSNESAHDLGNSDGGNLSDSY